MNYETFKKIRVKHIPSLFSHADEPNSYKNISINCILMKSRYRATFSNLVFLEGIQQEFLKAISCPAASYICLIASKDCPRIGLIPSSRKVIFQSRQMKFLHLIPLGQLYTKSGFQIPLDLTKKRTAT